MTKRYLVNAVVGTLAERPDPSNPDGGASETAFGLYVDVDTGDIYESTGQDWTNIGTLAGNGATSISGLTSDLADGIIVTADVTAGGNVTATGAVHGASVAATGTVTATNAALAGAGGTTPTLAVTKLAGQTGLFISVTDENGVPKISFAVDGEIVTADDVLAPTGVIKGATVALYTSGTGAPIAGAHTVGEFHGDTSGALFYCTASGTPGTWQQVTLT